MANKGGIRSGKWLPVLALPNLKVREAIGNRDIALVPQSDSRVIKSDAQPDLDNFLTRFTDAFGVKVVPAILIVRERAKETCRQIAAISGFRDLLAAATIPSARAEAGLFHGAGGAPIWSEAFSFYPWTLSKYGSRISAETPAIMGMHRLEAFKGQSDAGFPQCALELHDVDNYVFKEGLKRWRRHFSDGSTGWEDLVLFRSLNMARAAMAMPGGIDTGVYDIGRMLPLWISALEILLHPGAGKKVQESTVLDHIDNAEWAYSDCRDLKHDVKIGDKTRKRTAASHVCHHLYCLRNDFLHGNPIDKAELTLNGVHTLYLASSVYYVALKKFLGLRPPHVEGNESEAALAKQIVACMNWNSAQSNHEKLMLKAIEP